MKKIIFLIFLLASCGQVRQPDEEIVKTAPGWRAEVIAEIDQSYAGWDVEIGDADNDGANEVLVTGCPDSKLVMIKNYKNEWKSVTLAEDLAQSKPDPGMGLAVKVADLNGDGKNEIILGTGQERGGTAWLYIMQTDGHELTKKLSLRPESNKSSFTHDLAIHDLDSDGIREIISAYCGGGEVIRYDTDKRVNAIEARKIHHLSGSGEESIIADVDNDGRPEYLTSNSFREKAAKVEIFEFDENGDLILPPKIVIDGFEGHKCFYASLTVGDVDNDHENELIIGWKEDQKVNKGTILGYEVDSAAHPVYTFAWQDTALDMSYFEKMMAVADADNDGSNELVVSTRGDNMSEFISSHHLGFVFMFEVTPGGKIRRTLLADLNEKYAGSSWLAVGDADNDDDNEVILATGKGDRTLPGTSYVILLEKK